MALKWKKDGRENPHHNPDVERADCGPYEVTVDYDNDAAWTYNIETGCTTVREFGDYIRSFGSAEKAKAAAEKWLRKQATKMLKDLGEL